MVLVVVLIFTVTSCGLWTNFKTYFNTYYNANRIFIETETKILENKTELFSFEEIPIAKNLSKSLDEVIEKTSSILQHSKKSDFIDKALIMTGKSFYYQQNYSRALRKFVELRGVKDSELQLENELWIAKTYYQLREFSKANKLIEDVKEKALAEEETEILVEAFKAKIGYLIYSTEYEEATKEINGLLSVDIDDELRAGVLYELGTLYKENNDFEKAEKAFVEVGEYSPSFEVEFKSKFEAAKLKGELGNIDESLELLKSLREEDKFSDNWGDIDLEIGKIYYDKNNIEEALDKFAEVDTTYSNTEASAIAAFYRGEILENYFSDYDSALVFYKKSSSSTTPLELRTIAKNKTTLLNKYLGYHSKLSGLAKQFLYLTDNNAFIEDSLEYIEKMKLDSIANSERNRPTNRSRGRNKAITTKKKYKPPVRPKISVDSVHALNSKNYFELANLFYSEFENLDSAYYYYTLSLKEKENNPNQPQTYYALGSYYLSKNEKDKADSMFTLVYEKYPFNPIRNEAAKQLGLPLYDFNKDPVEEDYLSAESIYDSSKYQKAISKFFEIYKNNPKSIFAPKSLYTIGYVLENDLNMPDSAASIYDTLSTKYRSSEYAKAVQLKLSGYKQEQKRIKTVQDSILQAKTARLDSIKKASEKPLTGTTVLDSNKTHSDSLQTHSIIDSNAIKEEKLKTPRK